MLVSQKKTNYRRNIGGFTLLELLICLFILSLIFLKSFSFGEALYQRNKLSTLTNEITNILRYARHQAFITNTTLALHPLSSHDWSKGMVLFVDNLKHHCTKKDKIIYQWKWSLSNIRIQWQGFRSNDYLIFASTLSQAAASGRFIITNQQLENKLILNRIGHVRQEIGKK